MESNPYAAAILQVLQNAEEPVLIVLSNITEFVEAMLESTKVRIYFKQYELVYFNEAGYQRKRRLSNTYEIWIMRDMYDLQEIDLKKLQIK